MSNQNGLISSRTVYANGDPDSNFFIKNTDPLIINNLIAQTVTCDEIDINGGVITTADNGTVLEFNGVPLGTGNVATVGATAPLASTGGVNPVISLNDSGVVANTYTVAQITVNSKGLITSAASGVIPPNDDWSNFPAQQDVDMSGNRLTKLATVPIDGQDATSKSYVDSQIAASAVTVLGQVVKLTGDQTIDGVKTFTSLPVCSEAPTAGNQLVNRDYVQGILPGADPLSVVLGIGNSAGTHQIDMSGNKIVNLADPEDIQDAATKIYTDQLVQSTTVDILTQVVRLTGDQDISGVKTFQAPPVSLVNPTTQFQVANKGWVESVLPATPGLNSVLNVSNSAGDRQIDMSGNNIVNVANPVDPQDAATKAWVEGVLPGADSLATVLGIGNSAGASQIDMNNNKIINVANPTEPQDAATKSWVEGVLPATPGLAAVLGVSNSAGSSAIDMNEQNINNVSDITMSGTLPTIRNLNGSITITGGTTLNLNSAGNVTIGSNNIAGSTSVEYFRFKDDVLSKNTGADLTINDVTSLEIVSGGAVSFSGTGQINIDNNQLYIDSLTAVSGTRFANTMVYDPVSKNVRYQTIATLAETLQAGNETGGTTIDSSTGKILTNELEVASIKPLAFPIVTDIGFEGNIVMAPGGNVRFEGDALLISDTGVVKVDGIPAAAETLPQALVYDPTTFEVKYQDIPVYVGTQGISVSGEDIKIADDVYNVIYKTLYSNSYYVNDNVAPSMADTLTTIGASQGNVIYISAGSYEETWSISGKNNLALIAPGAGDNRTICEVTSITTEFPSTSQRIRLSNLQINGTLLAQFTGNNYYSSLNMPAGSTLACAGTGSHFFADCEFSGSVVTTSTLGGIVTFTRCNFAGAGITLNNVSPLQVFFIDCAQLPVNYYTTYSAKATFVGLNADTNLLSTNYTTDVKTNTIAPYSGASWASTNCANLGSTLETDGTNLFLKSQTGATLATVAGTIGPEGPAGPPGSSSSFYNYVAKTDQQSGDPGPGHVNWNNVSQLDASGLAIDHLDENGNDIDVLLSLIVAGDIIILQSRTNSNNYQKWEALNASTVYPNQYITIDVSLNTVGYTPYVFGNNEQILVIVAHIGQAPTPSLAQVLAEGAVADRAIDMNNNRITNVLGPSAGTDAANKQYVDAQIDASAVLLTGAQTVGGLKTFSILPQSSATPLVDLDFATKKYVDDVDSGHNLEFTLEKGNSAGIYSINMNNNAITNLPAPSGGQDATNKTYVDNAILNTTVLIGTDQEVFGIKTFNQLPESSAVPSTNNQLTNKSYVDGKVVNMVTTNTAQEISAVKTFTALPETAISATTGAQLVNKTTLDAAIATIGTPDLSQVLLQGATASTSINMGTNNITNVSRISGSTANNLLFLETGGFERMRIGNAQIDMQVKTSMNGYELKGVTIVRAEDGADIELVTNNVTRMTVANSGVTNFSALPTATGTPSSANQLVPKSYADGLVATMVTTDTPQTITGLKTFSVLPQSAVAPSASTDLCNKAYVDAQGGGGGSANTWAQYPAVQNVDVSGYRITNLGAPSGSTDAATKGYVDTGLATKVDNGTAVLLNGDQTVGGVKTFTSYPEVTPATSVPTSNGQFVNKYFADNNYVGVLGTQTITGAKTFTNTTTIGNLASENISATLNIQGKTDSDLTIGSTGGLGSLSFATNAQDRLTISSGGIANFTALPTASGTPSSANQLVTKSYVDGVIPSTPSLAQVMAVGSTMSANLNTAGYAITNVGDIAGAGNLDMVIYSDASRNLVVKNGNNNIFTGAGGKAFFASPPECTVAPTFPDQMANKAYVDAQIGSAPGLSDVLTTSNNAGGNPITNLLSITGTQLPGVAALPLSIYSGTGDLILGTATNQNAVTIENTSGKAFFAAPPECTVAPTFPDQMANKAYVDSVITSIPRTGATCTVTNGTQYNNVWMDGQYWTVVDFSTTGVTGTLTMTSWGNETDPRYDIIIVGGGGGGGAQVTTSAAGYPAGGGGGGGVVFIRNFQVTGVLNTAISVTVGAGGVVSAALTNGGSSSITVPGTVDTIGLTANQTYSVGGGGSGGDSRVSGNIGANTTLLDYYATNVTAATVSAVNGGSGGGGANGDGATGGTGNVVTGGGTQGTYTISEVKGTRSFYITAYATAGRAGTSSAAQLLTQTAGAGGGATALGSTQGNLTNSGMGGTGVFCDWLPTGRVCFGCGGGAGRGSGLQTTPQWSLGCSTSQGGARGAWFNGTAIQNATSPIPGTGSGGAGGLSLLGTGSTAGASGRVLFRFRS